MTQFMIIQRRPPGEGVLGVALHPVQDDFLEPVAQLYLGSSQQCYTVTDLTGRAESLVDDVLDAQLRSGDLQATVLVQWLSLLVATGVEFVCWYGGDFRDLPVVHSWQDVEREVRAQLVAQPAELYLHFSPQ